MNIFVVDQQPEIAAKMLCNSHVVKMILESCQLLSTAHHVLDGDVIEVNTGKRRYKTSICTKKDICKATMINHPCTIWVRESRANYMWLWKHAYALCKEYTARYGKIHAMEAMLMDGLYTPPVNIPRAKLTPFAQAMPEQYKDSDAVIAYRKYYINEKKRFAKWKNSVVPKWFSEENPELEIYADLPF